MTKIFKISQIQLDQGAKPEWNGGTAVITFQTLEAYSRARELDNKVIFEF